ncbi:MAG: hypothetical protein ABFS35_20985 [Bacteroidota bacterium]
MSEIKFIWDLPSIEIPAEFYSDKTGLMFRECSMCDHVYVEGDSYIIEKSFKRNKSNSKAELIFEYSLCHKCQENLKSELSVESLKNIQMYYQLYVDFKERSEKLSSSNNKNISNWISNCIITEKPIAEEEEFTIGGLFYDNKLVLDAMPFALSAKAIYEMQEILSKKTKDFLDGFQNEIFPPEIREKLPDGRLILL